MHIFAFLLLAVGGPARAEAPHGVASAAQGSLAELAVGADNCASAQSTTALIRQAYQLCAISNDTKPQVMGTSFDLCLATATRAVLVSGGRLDPLEVSRIACENHSPTGGVLALSAGIVGCYERAARDTHRHDATLANTTKACADAWMKAKCLREAFDARLKEKLAASTPAAE